MNSPFEWKVIDGHIARITKRDGETFGKLDVADTKAVCELIQQLDEDLWTARKNLTGIVTNLQTKIKAAKEALGV